MFEIEKGGWKDLDELERLYYELIEYLDAHTNYPSWKKGIYPARETAEEGIEKESLFVARAGDRIAGTVVLLREQDEGFHAVDWKFEAEDKDVLVVHTFAVHPDFQGQKVGRRLLEFAIEFARETNTKALRLDVNVKNIPAQKLYENCGFQYVDTRDMGYGGYGLNMYRIYQYLLV